VTPASATKLDRLLDLIKQRRALLALKWRRARLRCLTPWLRNWISIGCHQAGY